MTLSPERAAEQLWDLVVVGAGTAGLVGSRTAAASAPGCCVVEADRPGGDCLWTGCVPSKALLAPAQRAAAARTAARPGRPRGRRPGGLPGVMAHVRSAIASIEPVDSPEALEAAGVAVLSGWAALAGRDGGRGGRSRIRARQVLLATGSGPALPVSPAARRPSRGPATRSGIFSSCRND